MKRLIVFLLVAFAGLTQIAQAQVRGIPPSVTSLAPGRRFLPPPSVTSLAPGRQLLPGPSVTSLGPGRTPFFPRRFSRRGFGHFGRNALPVFVPYYTPFGTTVYPMIYAEPDAYGDSYDSGPGLYQPDPNYVGAYGLKPPGALAPPSSAPVGTEEEAKASPAIPAPDAARTAQPAPPPEPQPSTVLVFKDGHKLEVTNYAIQGATLYNFDDHGPKKIALAELDVKATVAENDDRGVDFKLP